MKELASTYASSWVFLSLMWKVLWSQSGPRLSREELVITPTKKHAWLHWSSFFPRSSERIQRERITWRPNWILP
uniref:Secreted protein n=1 Tax=Anguilla anguilla TaxID=7936 RepID=A0A0E9TRA2_ANGAN